VTSSHTILTSFWLKPIPLRCYDWEATTSNYEPGHAIGFGSTEADAVHDLKEQLWERGEIDAHPDEETLQRVPCHEDVGFGFRCLRAKGHPGFHTWDPKRLLGEEPVLLSDDLETLRK
jgi:hypothetical protein